MAEMLVLPRVSTKFKEDLRVTRYSKMVSEFQKLRQAACATLKAKLQMHGVVAAANDDKELQDALIEKLSVYKCPRQVYYVDAMPLTSTGKLQRFALRDRVLNEGS